VTSSPAASGGAAFLGTGSSTAFPVNPATGCGKVTEEPDPDRTHLQPGQTRKFRTYPPAGGAHDADPLPGGVYDEPFTNDPAGSTRPTLLRAVHSLEHGYVEIYYRGLSAPDARALVERYGHQRKVIVVPAQPMDSRIALVAWERVRRCGTVDVAMIDEFVKGYVEGPTAPEPAGQ
jgi:hypothetical protein